MRKLTLEELGRLTPEEFREADKTPIILVLDNVRSLNNVGSAFRTADAFRVEKLLLTGITGKPPHREIQKTALGATESVIWEHYPDSISSLEKLKSENYTIVCVEQTTESIPLNEFKVEEKTPYAIIFGNEISGVDLEIIKMSDYVIEIPQLGTKHSFNISVSIGIVLWEFASGAGYIK